MSGPTVTADSNSGVRKGSGDSTCGAAEGLRAGDGYGGALDGELWERGWGRGTDSGAR